MAKKAKTTKHAKRAAASEPKPPAPPVPSVTWDELVELAEADLDENGLASLEKRRHVAEKKWRRLKERGLPMRIDFDGAKRGLVAYYADCFDSVRTMGARKVFASVGARLVDYTGGVDFMPELWLAMDYICRHRRERDRILAEEAGSLAQESQMRLVTEEGCELNQKAVEVSLKATMKDVYGEEKDGGGKGGSKVMYNLPGLTVNMIMSPEELAAKQLGGGEKVSEVIDV
ncbi:MAG: hypothetical protein II649_03885 [Kiritimatiellae bacterium]|nr:hypothetical protein [Kiritimatiellia bacterium]MBQ5795531.1 hypothetical protein [Kiritimatiellia bacterium]